MHSIKDILNETEQPHIKKFIELLSNQYINKKKYINSNKFSLFLPCISEIELLEEYVDKGLIINALKLLNKLIIKNDKIPADISLVVIPTENNSFIIDRYIQNQVQDKETILSILRTMGLIENEKIVNELTTNESFIKNIDKFTYYIDNDNNIKLTKIVMPSKKDTNNKLSDYYYLNLQEREQLFSRIITQTDIDDKLLNSIITSSNYKDVFSNDIDKIYRIIISSSPVTKFMLFLQPFSLFAKNNENYIFKISKFFASDNKPEIVETKDNFLKNIISKILNKSFILYNTIDINILIPDFIKKFNGNEETAYKFIWILISIFLLENYLTHNSDNREGLIEHVKLLALKPSRRPYLDKILLLFHKILPEINYDIVPLGNFLYWGISEDDDIEDFILDSDLDSEND